MENRTTEGQVIYGCGHTHNGTILMNESIIGLSSYLCWKDDTGFDGDESECFDCYNKKCDEYMEKLEQKPKSI